MCDQSPVLTIAVSTIKENLPALLAYLHEERSLLSAPVHFLVISQLESHDRHFFENGIEIISSTERGLSKSRNLALESAQTEWVWFQDDDIKVLSDKISHLICFLSQTDYDLVLCRVGSLENPSTHFKSYERYNVFPLFLSFRVSSIELIVRSNFVRSARIRFDENLGLGGRLPSCEENLFFYDVVVKNRGRLGFFKETICLHTTKVESRNINYERRYMARGYLLGKMDSVAAPLMIVWWSIRRSKDNVNRLSRFKFMFKEYWALATKK